MSFDRLGFQKLCEEVISGNIEMVVIENKDRLMRFGYEMFKWFFRYFGTKILVLKVIITEESYTSKVDHSILESMCHHDVYAGKRVKRCLFKQTSEKVINADLNGAIGILRKVIDKSTFKQICRQRVCN